MDGPTDAESLLRMVLKYQEPLTGHAFALLRDWDLAQDAVQETFIAVHRQWETFQAGGSVLAWARQIVRFKAIDLLRKRSRERTTDDEELLSLVDQQFERHADEILATRMDHLKSALSHCMATIGTGSLGLLMGFYRDQKSCEELARLHEKSVNAVRLLLSRIRKALRTCAERRLLAERGA